MTRQKILLFLVLIVLVQFFVLVVHGSPGEIDETTVVNRVIDGDTFDTISGYRVRLADVNAPESGELGYYNAKNFLIALVYGKIVYLDIDDIYQTDKYGRLVCVVYVDYNSTHYENVNKALLVGGFAVIWDFNNEFNPYIWTLYVPKGTIPEFPSFLALPLFMILSLISVVFIKPKKKKQ